MQLQQKLKYRLESDFHVGFLIQSSEKDHFIVSFDGSKNNLFRLDVLAKTDVRLIIQVELEKYAGNLMELINTSTRQHRTNFCAIWEKLDPRYVQVKVNDVPSTPDAFLNKNDNWGRFMLRYNRASYFDIEQEDRDEAVCNYVSTVCAMVLSLFDYSVIGEEEGEAVEVKTTKYERNPNNRRLCIDLKGCTCAVCGMEFEKVYGKIGKNFIEVHHAVQVSDMEEGHVVDVTKELFPLCSNCHSMIHRKKPPYTIEELRAIVNAQKAN